MTNLNRGARSALTTALILAAGISAAAQQQKTFRYAVGPGASISVINTYGPVSVRPSASGQVIVTATTHSSKVEADCSQHGNRIQVQSHFLQRAGSNEGRVDYELQVPPDTMVMVRTSTGPITAQSLSGEVTLEADAAAINVSDLNNAHLHVRTVNGPVTLTNLAGGYADVTSVAGTVNLNNVSGQRVAINTTSGRIIAAGGVSTPGDYSLITHSGDIDVALPASAAVEITARSVNGSVQNDFPLQPIPHTPLALTEGRSLAGTNAPGADTGSAELRLRSFSGKIQVRKQ